MRNISSNNQYLLTVIIPFYNIGKQINKCIKRLNKIQDEKVEIIFIDDGSTDRIKKNIYFFIEKKSNYKLLKLRNNKGPGIARNKGILFSNGKFVLFLDSDDKLKINNFYKLLSFLKRNTKKDIVFYNYLKKKNKYKINLSIKKLNKNNIIKFFLKTELEMCSNFYCFRKEFLKKYNIKFDSGYYEDIVFMLKNFFFMKKFSLFDKRVYEKIDNKKSITNTYSEKHVKDFLKSVSSKVKFFKMIIKNKNLNNDLQFGLRGDYIFAKKIFNKYSLPKKSYISINKFFEKIINKKYKMITTYDKKVMKELFNK